MRYLIPYCLLFCAFYMGGCKCEPKETKVEEVTQNPNPPQNNNLMQNVVELGQGSFKSSIYEMTGRSDGNFYAWGVLDYGGNTTSVDIGGAAGVINSSFEQVVHLLNPSNASTVLAARPGFSVVRSTTIPAGNYPQSDYLLLTGEVFSNNFHFGKIMVYDKNGVYKTNFVTSDTVSLRKPLLLENLSDRLRFVAIALNTKEYATNNGYPEIVTFDILKSNNAITNFNVVKRFTDYRNFQFNDIERTQSGFAVRGGSNANGTAIIAHLDVNYNPIWIKTFQYNNEKTTVGSGCMTTDGNNIIVAGTAEDPSKGTTSDGEKWDSGFVAVFDGATGNIIWQKMYSNLSPKAERFHEVKYIDNKIVVGGTQAGVCYNSGKNCFNNGFIASINPSNGDILKSYTFGDAAYLPALKAGESNSTKEDYNLTTAGYYKFVCYADWNDKVKETNERDNSETSNDTKLNKMANHSDGEFFIDGVPPVKGQSVIVVVTQK
jgi:hypothetical protein